MSQPHPLVSVLVFNADADEIAHSLASIFNCKILINFEVVVCDDANADGTWDVINDFAQRHPSILTICRNQTRLGKEICRWKLRQLAEGEILIELQKGGSLSKANFVSEKPTSTNLWGTQVTEHTDTYTRLFYDPMPKTAAVFGLVADPIPLVSILIYNYNYGRYLAECLESVSAQTYSNIELSFADNASTDDSWKIAVDFAKTAKYPIGLIRHRRNVGAGTNQRHAHLGIRGKYLLILCSDDVLKPEYVAYCVAELEKNPTAAFAMVHREILDENNTIQSEPPFYDGSYLIRGAHQAAVYMMAALNASISQIMYNRLLLPDNPLPGSITDRWFANRIIDFNLCCHGDMVYLSEPLLFHRVHSSSDTNSIDDNLVQCMGQYLLTHQFCELASEHVGMECVLERKEAAIRKISLLCLRYAAKRLLSGRSISAERYFHLSRAIDLSVDTEDAYKKLARYWTQNEQEKTKVLAQLKNDEAFFSRNTSYAAPNDSVMLNPKKL